MHHLSASDPASVRIRRTMQVLWWIAACLIVAAWMLTLNPDVAGVDARYYFQAARDFSEGRNAYASGDYLYPPMAAWLLVPAVRHLSVTTLAIFFNVLIYSSVLLTAAGSFVLAGMKPGFGRRCDWWLILFLGAFLLFSPVTATATGLGNISPIIGALCVWAGVMHTRRHYMLAAILIAFASILKIIPGLLLIFMFWRGAGTRNGRLMLAAVTGAFIAAAGILLMPGTADFLKGAGGATKWGIDIGGAAVSIHVWLARLLDNPAINHPDSAMVVFAAGGVLASLYGYFMNHREMVSWGTVMVLADVTSPKNCPHLFLSMVFPVLVMFARHTAVTFAVDTTAAASKQPGPARTSSGGFISMILTGQVPASTGITRFGGFAFALSLPWIAVSSEYFYLKGSLTGEIILPLLPVTLILLQTWVLNRWNRTASKK